MMDHGSVKIVGLHHNFCLATELYSEGWVREQFADVVFYCRPSINSSSTMKRNLRANRSVLAASSSFFASLLPEGELENEICISTELFYSDLFCILEYVYSGKLLCSLQKKDEILSLLREYQVFVPDQLDCTELVDDQIYADEGIHFGVQQVTGLDDEITLPSSGIVKEPTRNTTLIQTFVVDEEEPQLKEVSELVFLPQQQQTFGLRSSNNLIYSINHRSRTKKDGSRSRQSVFQSERGNSFSKLDEMEEIASSDLRSISPSAFITKIPQKEFSRNLQPSQERFSDMNITITDDFLMSKTPLNRNEATLQIGSNTFSASLSPDHQGHDVLQTTSNQKQQSPTPLSDTWCDGVFSPFEPSAKKVAPEKSLLKAHPCALSYINRRKQQPVFNIGVGLDPVLLSSKPQRVYTRKEANNSADSKRIYQEKPQLNLTEVQTMITHKGKVHVTIADKSKSSTPLLNLSEEESSNQDLETNSDSDIDYDFTIPDDFDNENEEDKFDFNLARQFLQEELILKKKNHLKLRKYSSSLTQHMKIARKILKMQSNMDKNMLQREETKLLQPVRKSGPQVQCEKCGKLVLSTGLKHHLQIHSGVKSHLCELCGRAFLLKSYLNAHIRVNHRGIERPKRYMCSHCGHACYTKDKLEVHERVHTDERPFECQYCDKRFREKGTLVRHIRTHTGERPYACDICNTSYGARATYVEHYKRVHGPKPEGTAERQSKNRYNNVVVYRCEFCHKGFRRILAYEKHRATHTGTTAAVRCSQDGCEFTYSEMSQLRDHMAESHPTKTYSCSICSKVFLSKQNLVYHQSKHDSNLGFHCSYCTVSLTTKASLIAHEKIHTRETPYECQQCGERFHSPYLLKIHLRKHEPRQTTKRSRPTKRL